MSCIVRCTEMAFELSTVVVEGLVTVCAIEQYLLFIHLT